MENAVQGDTLENADAGFTRICHMNKPEWHFIVGGVLASLLLGAQMPGASPAQPLSQTKLSPLVCLIV